jgi:acyl dehydratase
MTHIVASPHDLAGQEGTALGPTDWLSIDQARIDAFADCTGDHQWIHVDVERAKAGPFGTTIAHGFLTLALVNYFQPLLIEIRGFAHAVNVGLDRVRFLAPVPSGTCIRAIGEIVKVEEVKGGVQLTTRVTIEIDGSDRPACIADILGRYFPD